jgi:hypothetical protein
MHLHCGYFAVGRDRISFSGAPLRQASRILIAVLFVVALVAIVIPADAQEEATPATPVYLPKGRPPLANGLEPGPELQIETPCQNGVKCKFFYVQASQKLDSGFGAEGYFSQPQPVLGAADSHSLAELAVGCCGPKPPDWIEVGWTVDASNTGKGSLVPRLFVYHWVDGKETGYSEGFMQLVGASVKPGDPVAVTDTPMAYAIEHDSEEARWWISYRGARIGYFPDSLWSNKFTSIDTVEWFGEVASADPAPNSWMGDGILGSKPRSASVRSMSVIESSGEKVAAQAACSDPTNPIYYDHSECEADSFRFGGPGAMHPVAFGPSKVYGNTVVWDPDDVLSPSELEKLGSNWILGARAAVKAISFHANRGQTVTFSASGEIGCCRVANIGPDGYLTSTSMITSLGSISGFAAPTGLPLVGVFTDGKPEGDPPPDFNYDKGLSQVTYAPLLNQVFFIGNGYTVDGSGVQQIFDVPKDATELWLGFPDAGYLDGPPADYGDNPGSEDVTGDLFEPVLNTSN